MNKTKIACRCHHVTYGQIQLAIDKGAKTYEEVAEKTRCGKGCGKCQEFCQWLVADLLKNKE